MENNTENTGIQARLIRFVKSKQFIKPLIAMIIGGLGGFLYYYFVGCNSGSCAITSDPYSSILMGSVLGLFLANSPCSAGKC